MKCYRAIIAAILYSFLLASAAAADDRMLLAWGLWNEPAEASSAPRTIMPKKEVRAEIPEIDSATQEAAVAKKQALEALKKFQESRRQAQEAEARRLELEKTGKHEQEELNRLREQAARERALALEEEKNALAESRRDPAERELEQAELARLRQQAAAERVAAEAERQRVAAERVRAEEENLRRMAARERAEAEAERQRLEAERVRVEEENLRRMVARERAEAEVAARPPAISAESTRVAMLDSRSSAPLVVSDAIPAAIMPVEAEAPAADAVAGYVIGPGDVLDVSVWRDESLSRTVTVSPDGTFSFPLIGDVQAGGRTLPRLKEDLERRIALYVPDPVITLEMKQAGSMQIYVIGKVNGPGRFMISSHVNVLQALAMAGGLNPFAEKEEIKVLREAGDGGTQSYDFDYKKVLRGENLEQNIRLQRGDVIVVP